MWKGHARRRPDEQGRIHMEAGWLGGPSTSIRIHASRPQQGVHRQGSAPSAPEGGRQGSSGQHVVEPYRRHLLCLLHQVAPQADELKIKLQDLIGLQKSESGAALRRPADLLNGRPSANQALRVSVLSVCSSAPAGANAPG